MKIIKDLLIVITMWMVLVAIFMGAALQKSYQYCPPTEDEIAQMGAFEKWIYEPFKEQ